MSTITDQLGRVLAGRYRLEAALGTGSSAHVFRASDLRLGRDVALKLLHPGLGHDEAFLRRFRAEAQVVASLSHTNLVRLYDWGWEEGEPFLVLEYLPGGSLRDMLDEGVRLSPAQAAHVGAAAARGLAYAHRRGLVHRDVKPANLLFDEEGVVRVADFGLARALADAAWTEPVGTVLGTARYASPEQAEGHALDGRSDTYALGLVLYEAVTGDVPFRGETTLATLRARIGATLPPARALGPLYPLLAQATIADPLARLDAEELAGELELLVQTLGRPPRLPVREPETVAVPVTRASSPPAANRPVLYDDRGDQTELGLLAPPSRRGAEVEARPRRSAWWRWPVVGVVLLALVGAVGFYIRRDVIYKDVSPHLVGLSLARAEAATTTAGLRLASAQQYSSSVPAGSVISASPPPGTRLRGGTTIHAVVSRGPSPVTIPLVKNQPVQTAEQTLVAKDLVPDVRSAYSETVAKNTVMAQSPAKGSRLPKSTVVLVVSLGPKPRTIPSNLTGATWVSARNALQALRLVPYVERQYSTTIPDAEVISTDPVEGSGGIAVGTRVAVIVSKGPQLVAVPTVAGEATDQAVASLRSAGLDVTEVVGPPFATQATTTDPAPGTMVAPGTSVTLYTA